MSFFYDKCFDSRRYQLCVYRTPIISKITDQQIIEANSDLLSIGKVLSREQEVEAFKRYNYFKYRIDQYAFDTKISDYKKIDYICKRQKDLNNIKELIVKCNVRLIVKPANKFAKHYGMDGEELFSLGIMYIYKCIDKFDYRLGFKFSTYFLNSANRNYYVHYTRTKKKQINNDYDALVECPNTDDPITHLQDSDWIGTKLKALNDSESRVIREIFGVDGCSTTSVIELSEKLQMSRQRIHQIKKNALIKLRKSID